MASNFLFHLMRHDSRKTQLRVPDTLEVEGTIDLLQIQYPSVDIEREGRILHVRDATADRLKEVVASFEKIEGNARGADHFFS